MFNKEKSLTIQKIEFNDINIFKSYKDISITQSFILMLESTNNENILNEQRDFDERKKAYRKRLLENIEHMKEYNVLIDQLYHHGQIKINDLIYPINNFYINCENHHFHLFCIGSQLTDILTNSKEQYLYTKTIKFKDTTAFINLINDTNTVIDIKNNLIIVKDKNYVLNILQNWDGLIHDKVNETDAIRNKKVVGDNNEA